MSQTRQAASAAAAATSACSPTGDGLAPLGKRPRKQNIAKEATPDSQFQVQMCKKTTPAAASSPMPNGSDTPRAASRGPTTPTLGKAPLKTDAQNAPRRNPRKRRSFQSGDALDDESERVAEELMSKDATIKLEKEILRRTAVASGGTVYKAVLIEEHVRSLQELHRSQEGGNQAESERFTWIADQPPAIDQTLVGKNFLACTKPWDSEDHVYRLCVVVGINDRSVVKVKLADGDDASTDQFCVPPHYLRIYLPIPPIEVRMMLTAKFRSNAMVIAPTPTPLLPTPTQTHQSGGGDGDGDNSDAEVAHINAQAQCAVPSGEMPCRSLTSSASQMFNRDRETRTPNRIFRTPSTRTPGAFIPGNGRENAGEAFVKGDVLCLGNMSRKRYNGSQWRSLCLHADGCDRESQRCGSCSLHSKGDSSRKQSTEFNPYPTPSNGNGPHSQQCTPSKESLPTRPDSEQQAAVCLLELSANCQETSRSQASSVMDASPMSGARPVHFPTSASPPSGAAQPSATMGTAGASMTTGPVQPMMSSVRLPLLLPPAGQSPMVPFDQHQHHQQHLLGYSQYPQMNHMAYMAAGTPPMMQPPRMPVMMMPGGGLQPPLPPTSNYIPMAEAAAVAAAGSSVVCSNGLQQQQQQQPSTLHYIPQRAPLIGPPGGYYSGMAVRPPSSAVAVAASGNIAGVRHSTNSGTGTGNVCYALSTGHGIMQPPTAVDKAYGNPNPPGTVNLIGLPLIPRENANVQSAASSQSEHKLPYYLSGATGDSSTTAPAVGPRAGCSASNSSHTPPATPEETKAGKTLLDGPGGIAARRKLVFPQPGVVIPGTQLLRPVNMGAIGLAPNAEQANLATQTPHESNQSTRDPTPLDSNDHCSSSATSDMTVDMSREQPCRTWFASTDKSSRCGDCISKEAACGKCSSRGERGSMMSSQSYLEVS